MAEIQGDVPAFVSLYDQAEYARIVRDVMALADRVNAYFDRWQPWKLANDEAGRDALQAVCSACLEAFRLLTLAIQPIVPALAGRAQAFLRCESGQFSDARSLLGPGHVVGRYRHLTGRVTGDHLLQAFGLPREHGTARGRNSDQPT